MVENFKEIVLKFLSKIFEATQALKEPFGSPEEQRQIEKISEELYEVLNQPRIKDMVQSNKLNLIKRQVSQDLGLNISKYIDEDPSQDHQDQDQSLYPIISVLSEG